MNVRTVVSGLRLPLYWASGGPAVISAALAIFTHSFTHPMLWVLGTSALLIFELAVNLVAEVSDGMEGVHVTQAETWIPTGPYFLERSGASKEKLLRCGGIAFAVSGVIGLLLAAVTGYIVILLMGFAGLIMTFIYAFPPFELGFRGIGEPVPFLAFGPLPMAALYYLSTGGTLSFLPLLFSLPTAFWITAVRYAHHLPDAGNKRGVKYIHTYNARLAHAKHVLTLLLLLAIGCVLLLYPVIGIADTLPLAVTILVSMYVVRILRSSQCDSVSISRITKHFVALQFAGTILIAVALLI
jgi:1,4-dihydroxy-2-naphthoate octaprenyltransferase